MANPKAPRPSPFDYYEASVQDAVKESRFFARLARKELGHEALRLREDFCGTFWLGHEWVRLSKQHRALGVDLDPMPIEWGRCRHGDSAAVDRFEALVQDVRSPVPGHYDLAVALNFSYFIFHEREALLEYFKSVRKSLVKPGLFVLDHFGGPAVFEPTSTRRTCRLPDGQRFVYVWDEKSYDPLTHCGKYVIHFEPKSGRPLRNVFVYDWRVWTLPELKDLLREAGFGEIRVYFESDDGTFRRRAKIEDDCAQWLAYIVSHNC